MRRPGRILTAALGLMLIVACSKQAQTSASADLKSAGHSLDRAVVDVAHDPALKGVAGDARNFGREAAADIKHAGADAKSSAHDVADDTRHSVHRATDDKSNG